MVVVVVSRSGRFRRCCDAIEDCRAVKGSANELVRSLGAEGWKGVRRAGSRLLGVSSGLQVVVGVRVGVGVRLRRVRRGRERGGAAAGVGNDGRGVRPGCEERG